MKLSSFGGRRRIYYVRMKQLKQQRHRAHTRGEKHTHNSSSSTTRSPDDDFDGQMLQQVEKKKRKREKEATHFSLTGY